MTAPLRRAAVAVAALLLASAAVVVPVSPAQAFILPTTTVGSVTYNNVDPQAVVWTQNSPVAVVWAVGNPFSLAADETIHIVQSPGMVIVIRGTEGTIAGSITADASLVFEGLSDLDVASTGRLTAGEHLVVTGAADGITNPSGLPQLDLDLTGSGSLQLDGALETAGGTLLLAAADLAIGATGTVTGAPGHPVHLTAAQTASLVPATGAVTTSGGVAGADIVVDGTVTATGAALRVDGGTGTTTVGGELVAAPGAVEFVGASLDALPGSVVSGRGGPASTVGALTGGTLSSGAGGVVRAASVEVGGDPGATIQTLGAIDVADVLIDGRFASTGIQASCEVTTSGFATQVAIGGLDDGGTNLLAGVDPDVAGQGPIAIPGFGQLFVHERTTTVVDGYEVLTVTALRLVPTTGDELRVGLAACARVAAAAAPAPTLPPTGAEAPLGLAVLLLGAGILLARRPRRA